VPDLDMKNSPVLIVGSLAFDDLEMPSGTFEDVVGGAATYSSIAASLLSPVRLVGVVGKDFPESVLSDLRARGCDTAGVEHADGKTFRWRGRYAPDLSSRETLDTQLNVFADFKPKLPASYQDSSYVFLGNIHPALQLEVLSQVKAPKFVAADTMNFWIEGERRLLGSVLEKVDMLVINDEELRQLAGVHNIRRAAKVVLDLGPKSLVVKRGEYGALFFDSAGSFFVPAFPLEDEIDPTGAGDTFAGALIGTLAQAEDTGRAILHHALHNAATVASFCVEGVGTKRLRDLTAADIKRRKEELRRLVQPSD
jgi:sugar/nucleoside kinase (ribokinase family)